MIHLFYLDNKYFVIDVNSGLIHEIDELVYDLLQAAPHGNFIKTQALLDKYPEEAVDEAIEELKSLIDNNQLFSQYQEIAPKIKPVLKAMCLNVAHDCNLTCEYCFASQGDYKVHRILMSEEVGKKALDFLLQNSPGRTNLEVDFFGGEPLMNFEVVKKLVHYGREEQGKYNKVFRFTITTNGVLLDEEKMTFINEHFDNIVLSADGRKQVNDEIRKTLSGQGSYDVIMPKIKAAVKTRNEKSYFIRGTFTGKNLDFSKDIQHFRDLGFKSLSMEPVVTEPGSPLEIKEEHLEQVKQEYERLYELYKDSLGTDKAFHFFHFEIDLEHGPCVYKRIAGCGAGNEYIAVTPEGHIYPCHQFVGEEAFIIGDVTKGIWNKPIQDQFYNSHVMNKENCTQCWAKYFCSGGCHANAYHFNQDFLKPYPIGCEMEKKRIECAIRLQAERMVSHDY